VLFVLLLLILVFVIIYWPKQPAPEMPASPPPAPSVTPECTSGEVRDCLTEDYCLGTKTCVNGKWSNCLILPMACVPGEIRKCPVGTCAWGEQECSLCGQWARCR